MDRRLSARGDDLARASMIGLAAALAAMPSVVGAQAPGDKGGGLEEIVVTAQKRVENLQEIPISVTAIGGESLEASGITDTLTLPQVVPSVQMTRSGPSNIFFIRGIGNTSGGTGEEGANAFYIDGVYLADLQQANTEFNNIERVEVLKGPQGTLFGRNASGGLVNVITKEPGKEFEAAGKFGLGNYDTKKGQVYLAGPVSETVSVDLALTGRDQNEGYGVNVYDGEDSMLGWQWGARSKVVWRPTEGAKLVLAGDYWKSNDDFSNGFTFVEGSVGLNSVNPSEPFQFAGDYNKNTSNPTDAHLEVWGTSVTGEFDLGFATLTSISAYRKLEGLSNVDSDFGPNVAQELYIPSQSKSAQQELRLASNSEGPLNWQIGTFLFYSRAGVFDQEVRLAANNGNDLTSVMKTNSYAGFGEVTYDVTPSTHLTAGVRYTDETRKLHAVQTQVVAGVNTGVVQLDKRDKIDFNEVTYRAAIQQDISDDLSVYVSYNRGFKSGLWALQSPSGDPVDPQTTDAYEVGLKSELFDHMVRLNLAGYHYKVDDYQIRAAPNAASPVLLNAATAKIDGIETDLQVAPTAGLLITANFNWLKAKFDKFPGAIFTYPRPAAACGPVTSSNPSSTTGPLTGGNATCYGDASGNRIPLAPKYTLSLGVSYTTPVGPDGELIWNANLSHNSGYYFEQDNRLKQPEFRVLNASVEYRFNKSYGIELWGNNLTNEKYYTTVLGSSYGDHGELRPPRTTGVNVTFDF